MQVERPTLAFRQVGPHIVLAHANVPPTNEDWQSYLALVKPSSQDPELRILVLTDNAGPTVEQRESMNKMLTSGQVDAAKTAVVSGGKLTRGIVTVLSWFNAGIRAFQPNDLEEALSYLGVGPEQRTELHRTIVDLRLIVAGVSSEARESPSAQSLEARTAVLTPLAALKAKLEAALP